MSSSLVKTRVDPDWRAAVRELNDGLVQGGWGLTAAQKADWPEVLAELEKRKRENPGFETLAQRRNRERYGIEKYEVDSV